MPHPYAEEPQWQQHEDGISFTRPLLGAEHILDQCARLADGYDELTIGLSFSSGFAPEILEARMREALGRLRFCSPLIAAKIVEGVRSSEFRSWVYTPAHDPAEVSEWTRRTLRVSHEKENFSAEDFVTRTNATKLPYFDNNSIVDQHFYCYLLLGPEVTSIHAFFIHASHAIVDGGAASEIFRNLFDSVARPGEGTSISDLSWGSEWRNLSAGPVAMVGGVKEGWDKEGRQLLDSIGKILANPTPPHSLKPQRTEITQSGQSVRAHRVLTKEKTARIVQGVKMLGFTMTQLWEAAHIMGTYAQNPNHTTASENSKDVHITLFPAIISLRHLIQPPTLRRTHVGILDSGVALSIPYPLISSSNTAREQMIAIMKNLKEQYKFYLNHPHIETYQPAVAGVYPLRKLEAAPNPYWGEITNLGVLDKRLPTSWKNNDGSGIEIGKHFLGLRQITMRTMTHVWSLHGQTYLQVQAGDIWDQAYLEEFLDRMVRFASLFDKEDANDVSPVRLYSDRTSLVVLGSSLRRLCPSHSFISLLMHSFPFLCALLLGLYFRPTR